MKVTSKLVGNTPTQAIDWDKPQLFIAEKINIVVLSTGQHIKGLFCASILQGNGDVFLVGEYSEGWEKNSFKPLPPNQQVILQNTPDEL
jgi:hypothetical protein